MSDQNETRRGPRRSPDIAELRAALRNGETATVRELVDAGADIHFKDENGYDALLDVVYAHGNAQGSGLLDLLRLLIDLGVDLSGVTKYAETGLRVLSRLGRFDAVRMLLDAGAPRSQLAWTPLMEAVALGSVAAVETLLAKGAALEERDWWSRTPWLLSLLVGDIEKATLLRDHGANQNACGRCGEPSLFYAIEGHHPDVLRWLLAQGDDVQQTDDFGATALIQAAQSDDLACAEILLGAGAEVDADSNGTALSRADSRAMALCLLDAGADPAQLGHQGQRLILGLPPIRPDALARISMDDLKRTFGRYFGDANPERIRVPFWEAMIESGVCAYQARERLETKFGSVAKPVWCAQRFGQSLTLLPDGRAIQIGGEHEDFYDPDFCIYNDVFVYDLEGPVSIYGYPESVFPPTDFHTATLVGDSIYVIGSLGYHGARRYGNTPVYRLNVHTFRIDPLRVNGESPGWIYGHRASYIDSHQIKVWGGTVLTETADGETDEANLGSYLLDLNSQRWRRGI